MKRRDLIRHLLGHGCRFVREGHGHSIYANREGTKSTSVPRHREIGFKLTLKICKDLDIPRP
ncbi:MAG: type II toxin-antitoxin system HicA family toxin [Tepidisphaeraceae bacterium]